MKAATNSGINPAISTSEESPDGINGAKRTPLAEQVGRPLSPPVTAALRGMASVESLHHDDEIHTYVHTREAASGTRHSLTGHCHRYTEGATDKTRPHP